MKLESLTNELLLDLFQYLDGVHLLRAFRNLNSRFDNLLFIHHQAYSLDFRRVSKRDFDFICQQYLPSIVDRVLSLHLSEDDDTPQQLDLFISYDFNFNQFIHLQSLLLYEVRSIHIVNKILSDCQHLPYLTHLSIRNIYLIVPNTDPVPPEKIIDFFNNIWTLPNLTHCKLQCKPSYDHFRKPPVISLTLKNRSIHRRVYCITVMVNLLKYMPNLQHLCVEFDNQELPTVAPWINAMKLSFHGSQDLLKDIFQNIANLSHLTIDRCGDSINGHEWKDMIVNYLPNLKVFRMKMNIFCRNYYCKSIEERVDELLDSFRTRFWLDEHQWFVRCDWYSHFGGPAMRLYTLPYAFRDMLDHLCLQWESKSTCPDNQSYCSYNHVHRISHTNDLFRDFHQASIYFPNIRDIGVNLPYDDNFWSIIPTLDHLTSLHVCSWKDNTESQWQTLLDRAPCLYSLIISQDSAYVFGQFKLTSTSIRRLELPFSILDKYLDSSGCSALASSPLGRQCEVLLIAVENRTSVFDLINEMPNLRALTFRCRDDNWKVDRPSKSKHRRRSHKYSYDDELLSSNTDELVEWMKDRLPSTCTITRDRDHLDKFYIRLWISK